MGKLTRRRFVGTMGAGTAAFASPWLLGAAEASSRPNIILIMADDLGIEALSCYGGDSFKTPHLDALAQSGIRFEICYSTPLCGPTRCQLITGRYPFRTGGLTNQLANRPQSGQEPSLARMFKQAGYATGMGGKWRQMGETPGDWGFDEYVTDPTAGGWYWKNSYTRNGQLVEPGKEIYYEDVVYDFAVDFIERHREGPFFFYYSMHLVHGPILRTPDSAPDTKDRAQLYADNVAYMDKLVGKLAAGLDRMGLRENTLILFTGDNGTAGRSRTIGGRQIHGQKGSMLEGGSRVPLIASWKGTTPSGRTCQDLTQHTDFYPTFAELARGTMPAGVTMDGQSFAPQLRGRPGKPRSDIFVQLGRNWYVRAKDWKLNNAGELFDMREAPFEERLVSDDTPAAAEARKILQSRLDELNPAAGKTVPPGMRKKPRKGSRKKKAVGEKAARKRKKQNAQQPK